MIINNLTLIEFMHSYRSSLLSEKEQADLNNALHYMKMAELKSVPDTFFAG